MAGILLFQPGVATYNESGDQHPAPIEIEVDVVCQLSLPGVSTATYRWVLTRPTGSASVLSSTTSAGPSFMPDMAGEAYSISCFDIDENEYILDIVTPTSGGGGGGGGGSVVTTLNTYADARAASYGAGAPPAAFIIQCRATVDDGGGGLFAYDPDDTTTADDDGTVLVDGEFHRFKRIESGAVNVKWFGAIGDDVANDTDAIQATFDAVPDGGSVFFPSGTYRIESPGGSYPVRALTLTASRVRIFGDGYSSRLHVVDAGDDFGQPTPPVSSYDAWHITGDQCKIENLEFYGDLADVDWEIVNSNIYTRTCIWLDASYTTIRGCVFHNLLGHVLHDLGAYRNNDVHECVIDTCYNGLNINSPYSKQTSNHVRKANGTECYQDYMIVSENTFEEAQGIAIYGDFCTVENNIIKDCPANGIILAGSTNSVIANNTVKVTGPGYHGIVIADEDVNISGANKISGNTVSSLTGHGIWLPSGAGSTVVDNITTAGNCALFIDAGAPGCMVDNNRCDGTSLDLGVLATGTRIGRTNVLINDTLGFSAGSLTQDGRTKSITFSPNTVEASHDVARVTMNGSLTLELPSPALAGARKRITVTNSTAQLGTTTITTAAGSILGAAVLVGPSVSVTYESDGTNWQCVSQPTLYPTSATRVIHSYPVFDATHYSIDVDGILTASTAVARSVAWPIEIPDGATLNTIAVKILPVGGHGALPATMPQIKFRKYNVSTVTGTVSSPTVDGSANTTNYQLVHSITMSSIGEVIANATSRYFVQFECEGDANAILGTAVLGITVTFTTTTTPDIGAN